MKKTGTAIAILLAAAWMAAQTVTFTAPPSLTKISATEWRVAFGVSRALDVEVSIVNVRDSSVVRHLAAGLMGSGAPSPLIKDSLRQALVWNARDDLGRPVTLPDNTLRARVRVGMSVQLNALLGDDPNYFYKNGSMDGIVTGPDGSVYICGQPSNIHQEHYIRDYKVVRKFNRDGNYDRTVFPPPANLPLDRVQGWNAKDRGDGTFSVAHRMTSIPGFSNTILTPSSIQPVGSSLLMMDDSGSLVFGVGGSILRFKPDGSIAPAGHSRPLIINPVFPMGNNVFGFAHATPIPHSGKVLFSGMYHAATSSGHLSLAPDTGFYRDGRIFRVDYATGAARLWLALDSVPTQPADRAAKLGGGEFYSSIHGTAVDNQGRVYVCDRLHRRIGVYDSSAVLLGSIACPYGDKVAVSAKTGAVYVLTRYQQGTGSQTGHVRLFKFAPFASGGAKICSLNVMPNVYNRANVGSMAIEETGAKTRIWAAAYMGGMRLVEDNGAAFTLIRDYSQDLGAVNIAYHRLCVDRRNETVYINDGRTNLYKISGWAAPKAVPCSTSAKKRLSGVDVTISPAGQLYVREGLLFQGPVTRYTTDWYHAPAPWPNTGANIIAKNIYAKDGSVIGERGMAVAPDGRMAEMITWYMGNRNGYQVVVFADSGARDTNFGRTVIAPLPVACGGVKYDLQGNLYVGAVIRTADHKVPASFAGDVGYNSAVGSVVKFRAGDSGAIYATSAGNAQTVYSAAGFSPFSNDPYGAGCLCLNPRFDLDPYGRLFVPDGITNRVSVLDNSGNRIIQFGSYGNSDSRGGLPGPGTAVPTSDIPMLFATSVVASEDFIYIADYANCRLARVKMNYVLDNVPGLTDHLRADEGKLLWKAPFFGVASGPVPFSRMTTVSFHLPAAAHARLDVMDARGRIIKTLAQGAHPGGPHKVAWNGSDANGMRVAAGLYVYRLTAGGKAMFNKTIFAK